MHSLLIAALFATHLGPMGSDAPAREPQLAAQGSRVALTFGAGRAIYCSTSHDGGKTFGAPVKVADAAILPLNRHRGPRIAFAGETIVITAVIGKIPSHEQHAHGLPSDGDLMAWRSTDGGKSWSAGIVVNDVPGAPTEGLHGLTADGEGVVFAAWLDKRSGKGTRLYGARSEDAGATWSRNVLIYQSPDGTICECCAPSAGIAGDGRIAVMWRNWLGGSRDLYLTQSRGGVQFSKPQKLGNGTWPLNACPMDGGGMVVSGERMISAWRRGDTVYLAEPGKPEVPIGDGKDVALALAGNQPYAIWSNDTKIQLWHDGRIETLAESGAFPALVGLRDGSLIAAWEHQREIITRRMR
ncbi:MAG TPA: sialidase family protein [Bryobacteraceae bacterium]|jgi:hypothetical protein